MSTHQQNQNNSNTTIDKTNIKDDIITSKLDSLNIQQQNEGNKIYLENGYGYIYTHDSNSTPTPSSSSSSTTPYILAPTINEGNKQQQQLKQEERKPETIQQQPPQQPSKRIYLENGYGYIYTPDNSVLTNQQQVDNNQKPPQEQQQQPTTLNQVQHILPTSTIQEYKQYNYMPESSSYNYTPHSDPNSLFQLPPSRIPPPQSPNINNQFNDQYNNHNHNYIDHQVNDSNSETQSVSSNNTTDSTGIRKGQMYGVNYSSDTSTGGGGEKHSYGIYSSESDHSGGGSGSGGSGSSYNITQMNINNTDAAIASAIISQQQQDEDLGHYEDYDENVIMNSLNSLNSSNNSNSNLSSLDYTKSNNWNEIYQNLLDLPCTSDRFRKISDISHDFVYAAESFGKIIISELYLPNELKTIKPLALGGVGGGLKYQCQEIIFKFVVDTELIPGVLWMYGKNKRSDEKAQKSASLEIKALNYMMEATGNNSPLIRFPLMAIIDYRGYRLLAISKLPIDKSTIVYGSADGGKSVYNDPLVAKEMARLAGILNLRGHMVGHGMEKKFIFGPGDIEVHHSKVDNRYYMIDFARIFPPEFPLVFRGGKQETIGREIFYNLLRPELVLQSNEPLSSDALSGWQKVDENCNEMNRDIITITQHLHGNVIPKLQQMLEKNSPLRIKSSIKSSSKIHPSALITSPSTSTPSSNSQQQSNDKKEEITTPITKEMVDKRLKMFYKSLEPISKQSQEMEEEKEEEEDEMDEIDDIVAEEMEGEEYKIKLKTLGYSNMITPMRDYKKRTLEIFKFLKYIHSKGVNIRYLGLIVRNISNRNVKSLFMTEVMARVWKKIIRTKGRLKMDSTRMVSDAPYKQILAEYFEVILSTQRSKFRDFWSLNKPGNFKYIALRLFPKCLNQSDRSHDVDLRSIIDCKLLALRLIQLLNIRIDPDAYRQFLSNPNYIISYNDIETVEACIKYLGLVDFSYGSSLLAEADQLIRSRVVAPLEVNRWLELAQRKLGFALKSIPTNPIAIKMLCHSYILRSNIANDYNEAVQLLKTSKSILKQTNQIKIKSNQKQRRQRQQLSLSQQQNSQNQLNSSITSSSSSIDEMHTYTTNINNGQKSNSSLLALYGMIHHKLATLYLFYEYNQIKFLKESKASIKLLEQALELDPNSIDEFILQSLPIYQKSSQVDLQYLTRGGRGFIGQQSEMEEEEKDLLTLWSKEKVKYRFKDLRKINELWSFCYLMIEIIQKDSLLYNYLFNVFKRVDQIIKFTVPNEFKEIFNGVKISQLLLLVPNLQLLSLNDISITPCISKATVAMSSLKHVRLQNVNYQQVACVTVEIQTWNEFFNTLLSNCPVETLHLESLEFQDSSFEGIHHLFSKVKELEFINCSITDNTLVKLSPFMAKLQSFTIVDGQGSITDQGLQSILSTPLLLSTLVIDGHSRNQCRLTDASAAFLAKNCCKVLHRLYINHVNYSSEVIADIVQESPHLQVLSLANTNSNQSTIEALESHGALNLTKLDLSHTLPIESEEYIEILCVLEPKLISLNLPKIQIASQQQQQQNNTNQQKNNDNNQQISINQNNSLESILLLKLLKRLPDLQEIRFNKWFDVSGFISRLEMDSSIDTFDKPLHDVKSMDLSYSRFTVDSLQTLIDLAPNLENLSLSKALFLDSYGNPIQPDDFLSMNISLLFYNLYELNLSYHPTMDKKTICCLLSKCPSLRVLHLSHCPKINNQIRLELEKDFPHVLFI